MVGRVWPRHGHRGRPLNSIVRRHVGIAGTRMPIDGPITGVLVALLGTIQVALPQYFVPKKPSVFSPRLFSSRWYWRFNGVALILIGLLVIEVS